MVLVGRGPPWLSHPLRKVVGMWLFSDRCGVCGAQGRSPCGPCARRLPAPPALPPPPGLDDLVALFAYEAGGRQLVTALKYHNRRGALSWMGDRLARRLVTHRAEAVTWVPASYAGRSRRGFDTGELLARHVARELRLPLRPLLERVANDSQSARSRSERADGPAMRARPSVERRLCIGSVVLIDDVSTTGASLRAGAEVLRQCGVRHIFGAVAARTPLHAMTGTA